jgi:hypothetical protein
MARRLAREEKGIAMALVVVTTMVLTTLAVTLLAYVIDEQDRSVAAVKSQEAFQAAEAGLDDYLAKLVDDRAYYLHEVHPAESTRRPPSGADVAGGNDWPYANVWTYPTQKNAWKALPNGFEYNLQIIPPAAGQTTTTILATGRKTGQTTGARSLQVQVRPSSLADFYRFSDENVPYGTGAILYGKVYANGQVTGPGSGSAIAYGDIYAWGGISGNFSMQNGAQKYTTTTNPSITTKIKTPIDFSRFLVSFNDLSRAAQVSNRYFDDPSKLAWRFVFANDGTFTVRSCTAGSNPDVAKAVPNCGSATTYSVPTNGAIYTGQTAIVEGQVKGRVTLGSNDDIVIANDIAPVSPGTDVLGLVAYNDLWIADYGPSTLTWVASLLVQTNTWHTTSGSPGKDTMNFTGSAATKKGGSFNFDTRNYNYDQTLQYLSPPWFPVLDDFLTISLFREVPA